jgi:hypothetical protein
VLWVSVVGVCGSCREVVLVVVACRVDEKLFAPNVLMCYWLMRTYLQCGTLSCVSVHVVETLSRSLSTSLRTR